jgi:hypothetical protein
MALPQSVPFCGSDGDRFRVWSMAKASLCVNNGVYAAMIGAARKENHGECCGYTLFRPEAALKNYFNIKISS